MTINAKMRILLTVFFVRSLNVEGGERTLHSLAKAYSKLGIKVTVVAPLTASKHLPYKVINYLKGTKRGLLNNIKAYIATLRRLAPSHDVVQMIEISPATSFFSRIAAETNPNTYVIFGTPLSSSANFVRQLGKMNIQYLKHFIGKNYFVARLWRYPCRKYIVSTEFQSKQLLHLGIPEEKIEVIPYGVLGEEFRPYSKAMAKSEFGLTGRQAISYIGHFHHIKGVPALVRAFGMMARAHPKAVLAIAWSGKGTESTRVLRMIRDAGIKTRIFLYGNVDVRKFLAASDMMVLPYTYLSLPHFPLVMIESFAMGVPVITTDVGGMSEMVRNRQTGLLVGPGSAKKLAEAMELLLANKTLRERISMNELKEFSLKYDSDVAAKKYLKLFKQ
jgi:glycosyltransferase involved in cell wall biosynthesis